VRVAQIVSYRSADGAFGGPTRVAEAQTEALARRGHDITLLAAGPSKAIEILTSKHRVRIFRGRRLSRSHGFALMTSLSLLAHLTKNIRSYDVVHVHLARDLVSLPAAAIALAKGVPVIVQTHGMIDASEKLSAKLLDALCTKRALRKARLVLTLTAREDADILGIEKRAKIARITNGIDVPEALPKWEGRDRSVLFLARMHTRKRPTAFVRMAEIVAPKSRDVQFVMAGPDEGESKVVEREITERNLQERIQTLGPVDPAETGALMARSAVYVLPSVDEVFPMTLLEAFQNGTPVVTTESLGIAGLCGDYGAAILTDGSPHALARAVEEVMKDPHYAERLRQGGRRLLDEQLSISQVAATLEEAYLACTRGLDRQGDARRLQR
jgi:glycosyltransferase involved in cell wall biosynthesis